MSIRFHKMHGAGNDFVLLDLRKQHLDMNPSRARELADRHTGIGCDQVLVLRAPDSEEHLARFEVWNADGSRAEQCGNGVRCIGLYLFNRRETGDGPFSIEGTVAPVVMAAAGDDQFRVDMGVPDFRSEAVPLHLEADGDAYALPLDDIVLEVRAVSMGNPHAVLQVPDVDTAPVASLGPRITRHAGFPEGCNAGFAQIVDRNTIRLRVFERGAGETRACGSGACAAAATLMRSGSLDTQVLVKQGGGDLIIGWEGEGHAIMMTGPAAHVFEGILL